MVMAINAANPFQMIIVHIFLFSFFFSTTTIHIHSSHTAAIQVDPSTDESLSSLVQLVGII